jgi:3D-(3,5/4)-trihydroxycyclohexane-1,2-dione acylhydrolase (decyclizing)
MEAKKIVVRAGGGSREAGPELVELMELVDAVSVVSPVASGVVPYSHPRNMTVSGTMGSSCGNYAMENADLLIAVGTRFVCLSDSSRTAYPNVNRVININTDPDAATHYGKTIAMVGDAGPTLRQLIAALKERGAEAPSESSAWMNACTEQRQAWEAFKAERRNNPTLFDERWGEVVLTQPAAIKIATDWARANEAVCFFDAGDVQGNGLQTVEDEQVGGTFTDTGASYMGFSVSSLLATALADEPFYGLSLAGDGSFTMCPQILIDGVQHGAQGCILVLDNRRMGTISGLQVAQYGSDHATSDSVEVDYVALAGAVKGVNALDGGRSPESLLAALENAKAYNGLSFIHVPVYWGSEELGGLGLYGRWNVGNWCQDTQALRHEIGL